MQAEQDCVAAVSAQRGWTQSYCLTHDRAPLDVGLLGCCVRDGCARCDLACSKQQRFHKCFDGLRHLLGRSAIFCLSPTAGGAKDGPCESGGEGARIGASWERIAVNTFAKQRFKNGDDEAVLRHFTQAARAAQRPGEVVADAEGDGIERTFSLG